VSEDIDLVTLMFDIDKFLKDFKVQSNVTVMSCGFNICGFDENFLFPFRVYGFSSDHEFSYFLRNGGIIACDLRGDKAEHMFRWSVKFTLMDVARYWTLISLAGIAKALKLKVQKGFCPHELCHEFYMRSLSVGAENTVDIADLTVYGGTNEDANGVLEMWDSVYSPKDAGKCSSLRPLEKVDLPILSLWYCMLDVIVSNDAMDVMHATTSRIALDLFGFSATPYNSPSIPAMSMKFAKWLIERDNLTNNWPSSYAPQLQWASILRDCVIGGRSMIAVLGVIRSEDLAAEVPGDGVCDYDINGMYGGCQTAPYTIGKPFAGCMVKPVKAMADFLARAMEAGWRDGYNNVFSEWSGNFGCLFAMVNRKPPSDRRFHLELPPMGIKDRMGSLVWSFEDCDQYMCSVDMETCARSGWTVTILTQYPMAWWPAERMVPKFKKFTQYFGKVKTDAKRAGQPELERVAKLFPNSFYGGMLKKSSRCKLEVVPEDKVVFNKDGVSYHSVRNPGGGAAKYFVKRTKIEGESQPSQNEVACGVLVLAYSRRMIGQWIWWLRNKDTYGKVLPEDRKREVFASETDSIHGRISMFKRQPVEMIDDIPCEWNDHKSDFDIRVKPEAIGALELAIVAKKVYMYKFADPKEKKFASKGYNKAEVTWSLIKDCLRYASVGERNKVKTTKKTFKREFYGMNVPNGGTIRIERLTRFMNPNHYGTWMGASPKYRLDDYGNRRALLGLHYEDDWMAEDLSETYVSLKNFDVAHPQSICEPKRIYVPGCNVPNEDLGCGHVMTIDDDVDEDDFDFNAVISAPDSVVREYIGPGVEVYYSDTDGDSDSDKSDIVASEFKLPD